MQADSEEQKTGRQAGRLTSHIYTCRLRRTCNRQTKFQRRTDRHTHAHTHAHTWKYMQAFMCVCPFLFVTKCLSILLHPRTSYFSQSLCVFMAKSFIYYGKLRSYITLFTPVSLSLYILYISIYSSLSVILLFFIFSLCSCVCLSVCLSVCLCVCVCLSFYNWIFLGYVHLT